MFIRRVNEARREIQLAARSGQQAGNESLAFGVIRSLRCAVICRKRKKSEVGGRESEIGSLTTEDPSEIIAAGEFHGASRRQMAGFPIADLPSGIPLWRTPLRGIPQGKDFGIR